MMFDILEKIIMPALMMLYFTVFAGFLFFLFLKAIQWIAG